ncbi:MAG TPA: methyltransferase domain-containing protein [Candidatus Dormibacteraeota bacterium]|nr:methyltransferase domain-containing protein [Candidatus Dormibacteraeota bacterium]
MKSKELYPSIFSRHAGAYQRRLNEIMRRGQAQGRQRVIELLNVTPGMRVLDLACGPGTLSGPLAKQVGPDGEVIGIDLAPGMIELARAAGLPNARFEVMDIEQLLFPDATFDAAACGHGIQFAPDLGSALRETRRVLRPGAKFAASVPVGSQKERPWALVEDVVNRYLPPAPQAVDQQATRAVVADVDAFRTAAIDAGFDEAVVEVTGEVVRWKSAGELVALFMSWWDCAVRLEGVSSERSKQFAEEALVALTKNYPGVIETRESNHVLFATA